MKKTIVLTLALSVIVLLVMAFQQAPQKRADTTAMLARIDQLDSIAENAFYKGDYNTAVQYYDSAVILLQKNFPDSIIGIETAIYNKAHSYMRLDDHKNALRFFTMGLEMLEGVPEVSEVDKAYNYQAIGVIYRLMGDYYKAKQYLGKALSVRLEALGEDHLHVAASYMVLGRLYKELGQYDKAMELLNKTLEIRLRKKEANRHIANTYNTIALTLKDLGHYNPAIDTLQKALAIQQATYGAIHPDVARTISQIGIMYLLMERCEEAYPYLQESLQQQLEAFGAVNVQTAMNYQNIARCKMLDGDFDGAIEAIDEAIAGLNFTALDKIDEALSPYHAAIYLSDKAIFYQQQSIETDKPALLLVSDSLNRIAIQVIHHLQKVYNSDFSNVEIINKGFRIFERALQTDFQLQEHNIGQQPAQHAFEQSERSKAFVLRQAYQRLHARNTYGLPEELLAEAQALETRIVHARKFIYEKTQRANYDTAKVNAYQDSLFQLTQAYDAFLKHKIQQQYPRYYKLKFSNTVVTVPQVQEQLLEPQQALVEYFVGDQDIFIFVIQPHDFHFIRLDNDFGLNKQVKQMRDGIYGAILGEESHYDSLNQQYAQAAHLLYTKLVLPVDTLLKEDTEIIIVPDGVLGYIPFEALLVEAPESASNMRSHNYLLKNHPVSYAFSATSLMEANKLNDENTPADGVWLVNPFAGAETASAGRVEGNTPALLTNTKLAKIAATFSKEVHTTTATTKEQFLQSAADYRILHLATHGQGDTELGDFSFLLFHGDDQDEEAPRLYASELYNLQLKADMVVLSACETAFGEWRRGEGIISLARGFVYAGAKSVVSSLWKVEDHSTSELMGLFYQHLNDGLPKNKALQQAKLDFLQTSSMVEPFFWAGFIPIGDVSPLYTPGYKKLISYGVLGMLGLLFIGFLMKRRKNQAEG